MMVGTALAPRLGSGRRCRVATLVIAAAGVLTAACAAPESATYDLVISGGRVMDPESGLDAVRYVGIRADSIAAISETPIRGEETLDASGMVVAPGFVDLHQHGQEEEAYGLMVRDGVTTAFELEVGSGDVDAWYAEREAEQVVNHGVSSGHIPVRMRVLGDPGTFLPAGVGGSGSASDAQLNRIEQGIRDGLEAGAVAAGFGSAYTPGATMAELTRMFAVAAEYDAPIHIHMRGDASGLDSTLTAASIAGASLHIVHLNSSAGADIEGFLNMIGDAQAAGQDVTTEIYPYGAGMTEIQSALFDDWESWPDERFADHQWVATGERLTRASFGRYRAEGGTVIIHSRPEEWTQIAVSSPIPMIASDGYIVDGRGHPRSTGTYSKVLGRYVRDEGRVDLMEALSRMSLQPAQRLERRVPSMARKGRLQVGMDADITIFNLATVMDRSTYEEATIPPVGIPFVLVGGAIVVREGELTGARPGVGVRAPVT